MMAGQAATAVNMPKTIIVACLDRRGKLEVVKRRDDVLSSHEQVKGLVGSLTRWQITLYLVHPAQGRGNSESRKLERQKDASDSRFKACSPAFRKPNLR